VSDLLVGRAPARGGAGGIAGTRRNAMARDSLLGPLLGTLVFVALVPGTVIGWIPYFLTGWRIGPPLLGIEATRWLGIALMLVGAPLFVGFLARFVVEGRGTPAPVAPTERLVVGGPFRWSRNPGYIGVVSLVLGQALLFGSFATLVYAVILALGFHTFVVLYEEPTLRSRFGAEYEAYCRDVPRWLPRLGRPRARPPG
jgi:protein-S-isoprenylcysteine O-methyltransferase Ste14